MDDFAKTIEIVTDQAVPGGKAVDGEPRNRPHGHTDLAIGRERAERTPFKLQVTEQVGPGRDAGQILQVRSGSRGGLDYRLKTLAPIQLPDQGVDQFFVSAAPSALRRCATMEPA